MSERGELQAGVEEAGRREEEGRQERRVLEERCREAEGEVLLLRQRLEVEGGTGLQIQELRARTEGEVKRLQEEVQVAREEGREVGTKLAQVTIREAAAQKELKSVRTELEMAQVHLTQLRGSGAAAGGGGSSSEVASLTTELGLARSSLAEALASRDHVGRERDQLAEQYRSYSRDLATQAERLSEQLRRYQEENAKMVHREAGLVQHVSELEAKLQKFIQGGKNVTEEEICRLKDSLLAAETELRLARDERLKLQEMFTERSDQVEDTMKRLAVNDNKVLELRARVQGLETQVEMLQSTSQSSCSDQVRCKITTTTQKKQKLNFLRISTD